MVPPLLYIWPERKSGGWELKISARRCREMCSDAQDNHFYQQQKVVKVKSGCRSGIGRCAPPSFLLRDPQTQYRGAQLRATSPPEIDSRTRGFLYGTVRAAARAVGQFELLREPIPRSFIARSCLYFALLKCTVVRSHLDNCLLRLSSIEEHPCSASPHLH